MNPFGPEAAFPPAVPAIVMMTAPPGETRAQSPGGSCAAPGCAKHPSSFIAGDCGRKRRSLCAFWANPFAGFVRLFP